MEATVMRLESFLAPEGADLSEFDFLILRLREAGGAPGAPGVAVQRALISLNTALLTAGVMCDESPTEPPSAMDATFRGGKVIFTCYHSTPHSFEVDV